MQNCKEFANGGNYIIEEVKNYIKSHKETISENFPFQDGSECWSDREVLDVEEFLEWLNTI